VKHVLRSSRDRGTSRKDRAVSDECLRILLTWYTIEGDRAVSREARRAPEASKGTLTTLVAAKRLGRRHPANTYPTIQKTKQKTNVPRCSDARISCSPPPSLSRSTFQCTCRSEQDGSIATRVVGSFLISLRGLRVQDPIEIHSASMFDTSGT